MTILQRIAAGDDAAVSECLNYHGALVWVLARRGCATRADAEDAVQDIFLDLWKTAHRYDPSIGSEKTFIASIARRRIIDRFRREKRSIPAESLESEIAAPAENATSSEIDEEVARAREGLKMLRPEERSVLQLSIEHEMSYAEVSQRLSLPLGTVKSHARRGLNRLREYLGAYAVPVETGGRS